jgi:purine-binding chemotaxis protein CheW
MSLRALATFQVGDLRLGVEIGRVREILYPQPVTPVPLAPAGITGILHLRGEILATLDLRSLFGMEPREEGKWPAPVILQRGRGSVALLVDSTSRLLRMQEEEAAPPPPHLDGRAKELVTALYRLPDHNVLELNIDRILAFAAGGQKTVAA